MKRTFTSINDLLNYTVKFMNPYVGPLTTIIECTTLEEGLYMPQKFTFVIENADDCDALQGLVTSLQTMYVVALGTLDYDYKLETVSLLNHMFNHEGENYMDEYKTMPEHPLDWWDNTSQEDKDAYDVEFITKAAEDRNLDHGIFPILARTFLLHGLTLADMRADDARCQARYGKG